LHQIIDAIQIVVELHQWFDSSLTFYRCL